MGHTQKQHAGTICELVDIFHTKHTEVNVGGRISLSSRPCQHVRDGGETGALTRQ